MRDQALHEFLAEAEDLIEVLFGDLKALRARHAEGRARRELIARIFRHVHTLKGSAATVELETTMMIAHEFEALLDRARMGHLSLDETTIDAFDDAADAISQSLSAAAAGSEPPPPATLLAHLRQLAGRDGSAAATSPERPLLASLPEEIARSLTQYEEHRLRETAAEGARVYAVKAKFELATFDESFRNLSDALAEDGELIATQPAVEGDSSEQITFRILYAAQAGPEELAARLAPFDSISLAELQVGADGKPESTGDEPDAEERSEGAELRAASPLANNVRVELEELEAIISAAHELLAEADAALGTALALELPSAERELMEERAAHLRSSFLELEERLIALRMVPVGRTLERAARAGRMAARATSKEVDFETTGGQVCLDKPLADSIFEPLLHILRNAVDHGIETPSERAALGKSRRGRVRLEALAEGNRVVLRVTDDGRGIDPQRIARAAAEQGLLEAGRSLTKEQSLRLIFRPSFSTAAAVSSTSGRGVGLDIVERAVEQAGGQLRITSEAGAGTTFELLLPTTLALLPLLLIGSAGSRYGIDARHVAESLRVAAGRVEPGAEGGEAVRWRGSPVPLVRLRRLLGQPPGNPPSEDGLALVIVRAPASATGEAEGRKMKEIAVAVDELGGPHQVLVRSLGRHTARWRGIQGATELGDGTVALVLDLPRLLKSRDEE
ncbi:MAG TPA: ATP-binding protein [Pyrinomonadaceae bacterium]|jgi:two-component system chemotaxis sensor kinase CheA